MKPRVLIGAAFLGATYLSAELTVLGLDKFHYVLAGGKKFGTLPNLENQLEIGLSYLALSVLYLVWFLQTQPLHSTQSRFIDLLRKVAPFLSIAFLAYPLGDDVYLYLHAGLMNLSGVNPFITRAAAFTTVLSPFVDWGQTSTYGPISQLLFTLSAAVISIDPILAVYVYKSFCLGLHIFNSYMIWRLLPAPDRHKITIAYLIHPLLLMEQVGSGHVDVLVSTSLVVFAGCLLKQRYEGAFMTLWGGFLAKTIPLIWIPLVTIFLVRQRQWKALMIAMLLCLGCAIGLSFTILPGWIAWKSLLNPGVAGQSQSSLHTLAKFGLDLLHIFSPDTIAPAQAGQLLLHLAHYALLGFAAFYIWTCLRAFRQPAYSPHTLIADMGWVTLVLLLFATPWLMPWYASILLTIAALIPQARLFGLTSLVFGLSSSAQYLLQGHNSLKGLVAVGLPLLALMIGSKMLSPRSPKPAIEVSP